MSELRAGDAASTVLVELGTRSYPIAIVNGVVAGVVAGAVADGTREGSFWRLFVDDIGVRGDVVLVTNDTLAPLYGERLHEALAATGRRVVPIVVADGERFKNAAMLEAIHDAMLAARCDRSVTVFALGGGVVGDVAGFAAATYQRGVALVQVPTTLLAQVDSSVGGKTGINHRLGKNMIGAFHQPIGVVIDLATLATLPPREFAAGLAEVIKYGAALDADFFAWLETAMRQLLTREPLALAHAIRRCCELKAMVVGVDERESGQGGQRALLNFGHTFGHAIEGATGYGTWLHGEAVAAGMVMAGRLSMALGLIDESTVHRLMMLLRAAALPTEPPPIAVDAWRRWMASDKKADAGRLRFVLMSGLGSALLSTVDDALLDTVLRDSRVDHASLVA